MGSLRQLFERYLRVLAQHDNNTTEAGTPVPSTGASAVVAAFSGYLYIETFMDEGKVRPGP